MEEMTSSSRTEEYTGLPYTHNSNRTERLNMDVHIPEGWDCTSARLDIRTLALSI